MADRILKMPHVNRITISGNVAREPELRYTPKGVPVLKYAIGFTRYYQKDDQWEQDSGFINITTFGKAAERQSNQLHKGMPVLVEGYIRQNRYTDKNNIERNIIEIVSDRVYILEKRDMDDGYPEGYDPDANDSGPEDDKVPF